MFLCDALLLGFGHLKKIFGDFGGWSDYGVHDAGIPCKGVVSIW